MITIALIILGIIVAALSLVPDSNEPRKSRIVLGVLILLVGIVQPYSIERVDAGYVGIKVNLTGSDRGVGDYEYATGYVVINTWFEQLYEFPMYQQHVEYDKQTVITKGGFSTEIKPTFNYSLVSERVGDMFVNLRLSIKEIEAGWLLTAIVGAVNDVSNKWPVDSIFNNRESFENAIVVEANKRVKQWFVISQLRTNIAPPQALQDAIILKTRSIQLAQAEEQKAITAEAEMRRKMAEARGDSAQRVIEASGKAEAIRKEQMYLTPEYINYIQIQKWNGVMPSTVLGSSSNILLNR
jgi:regulator of protease activity HflC (stomatin/prohibitin superfamily)